MSITIQIESSLENRLREGAANRGLSIEQMLAALIERSFPPRQTAAARRLKVSKREAELLQKINLDIAPEVWATYHELKSKRQQLKLSPNELTHFQEITEQIELANAEWLAVLLELSKIRHVSLRQLMLDLGLANLPNE